MDLVKVAINRPVFISMATLFMVTVGALALSRLPVDLYPDVSYPVLAVRANLDGAAPEEIEQLITKRLEDTLSTVAGVEKIRSISREGSATVILEFSMDTDIRFQEIQVRAKVSNMRRSLPDETSEPTVFRQDPDDTPIIELTISGDRTVAELTELAEDEIANPLRQITGVGEVELDGGLTREVRILLRPEALEAWGIEARDVVTAIRNYNRNDPVGKLEGESRMWVLRSLASAKAAENLGDIGVGRAGDGKPIFLRDIATIENGFEERRRVNRLGSAAGSKGAVGLEILKQSGENSVAVSDNVRAAIEEIQARLPSDIKIDVTRDNADLIRSNVADVFETLIIGAFLTIAVVLMFLRSPRSTFTTGLALPASVVTTFAAMAFFGFTVNVMTLLALSLAIGLLVDDAIVVRENIFRHMQMNKTPAEAAYQGTKEVLLAVLATTLTIVAVFLPVGFMGGVTGQFFKQFALTVVFAIFVSMWDALTMAPMMSTYYANVRDPAKEWKSAAGKKFYGWLSAFEHSFDRLGVRYGRLLTWMLPRPWVAGGSTVLALALAVFGFSIVKKGFLPTQLGEVFSVTLNGPLAMPIEPVLAVSRTVEEQISKVPAIDHWTIRAGSGWSGNANVNLTVTLKEDAAGNQDELAAVRDDVRKALSGIPGYTVRISEPSDPLAGGGGGRFQPLAVQIRGDEIDKLRDIAREVSRIMEDVPGVTDISPIDDEGLPEIRLFTEPALAAQFDTNAAQISESLRVWVEGDTSNSLRVGDDQIPIRVKLDGGDRLSPTELLAQNIRVTSATTRTDVPVPLGNLVRWESGAGPPVIVREDRQRVVRVGAGIKRNFGLADVVSDIETKLRDLPLPNGYSTRMVGQNEQMGELLTNVLVALGIGSLFVYMILAALFESLTQPLTVMAAIPLASTGAVAALLMTNSGMDLYAGIGMILLAGIVAKNSILLIDFAIQRVREGAQPIDAIIATAPLRLRPILMTSVAMIAGMIPVATGIGASGASRASLGIATIGGVVSSTLLTLLVVPSLYVAIEAATLWTRKRFGLDPA
jgi:HAE1 family hydrophobic/amphiphilic exporter-1